MDKIHSKSRRDDKTDQKATNILLEKLDAIKTRSHSPKGNLETTPTHKRKLKFDGSKNHKITTWLNNKSKRGIPSNIEPLDITVTGAPNGEEKSNSTSTEYVTVPSSEKIVINQNKLTQHQEKVKKTPKNKNILGSLQERPTSGKVKREKKESRKSLKRSPSFDKYGIVMPSFEKILADVKKFEKHKDIVKQLDVFDDSILEKPLILDCLVETKQFDEELLDCKHLTLDQLEEAFQKHQSTLIDIMNGNKYSERHKLYKSHVNETKISITKDLRCSPSVMVFTQEQKDHLINLMTLEFDPDDKLTSYFFKVLLPEICLLVFMDEHGMGKRKASAYLDKRPLDN